jgi:[acyl-carrier-protein] S-malonyltransferase
MKNMISFVFPGQGSQYSGMGKSLAEQFPAAAQVYEEANDALGFDLGKLCFSGSDEDLKLTANTQPAILATSVAALRVMQQETGLVPDYVAGHSLGEYSALVAAGALSLSAAVSTVRQRGTFMQEAVPVGTGSMAAILGVDAEILVEICRDASSDKIVAPANFNSPGQIVIAGHTEAVDRALVLAKERGAKRALVLPVSAPFHSSLMQPAADRLAQVLEQVSVATMDCPLVSNVEAVPYQESSRVKPLLIEQVCAPVLWAQSIEAMNILGVDTYVEIGPGKVLTGLLKRIDRKLKSYNMESVESLSQLTSLV